MKYRTKENITLASLVGITGLAGILLTLPTVSAETEAVDTVTITVPSACSMSSTITTGNEHTATVDSGTYKDDIGETSLKTICNDSNGFSIYAIGYTDDTYGNTKLKSSVGATSDVNTGIATSGNTSNWAMKLEASTGTYAPTIETDTNGSFASYHVIPSTYTKVASFNSTTDSTIGSTFTTTYAVYMNATQPAGTYTGKVKYTLVHPASEEAPLHPMSCTSGKVCYFANASNAVGTMGEQTISDFAKDWSQCAYTDYSTYCRDSNYNDIISSLSITDYATIPTLLASNYSRVGYGFAGWSDAFDYLSNPGAHFYGPQEALSISDIFIYTGEGKGLSLYAVWVKSVGSLQDSEKVSQLCGTGAGSLTAAPINGTANLSSVSALTDQRDNQTYAIAKLADGKCWMIENLRLESTASHNSDGTLAQGYNASFIGLATAESGHFSGGDTTANSLYTTESNIEGKKTISGDYQAYRFPRYNNLNTQSRASNPTSNKFNENNTDGGMYSYGNYYTWHAAIADTTHYSSGDHNTTSICPSGWQIPLGNTSTGNIEQGANDSANKVGGFSYLDRKMGGTGAYQPTAADSLRWRKFPLNYLYSGYVSGGSLLSRGAYGYYWSATADFNDNAYGLYLYLSSEGPGTGSLVKYNGRTVRCVANN